MLRLPWRWSWDRSRKRWEEESRRRCNAVLAESSAQKRAAVKMQSMRKVLFEDSAESGGAEQLPVVDESALESTT